MFTSGSTMYLFMTTLYNHLGERSAFTFPILVNTKTLCIIAQFIK